MSANPNPVKLFSGVKKIKDQHKEFLNLLDDRYNHIDDNEVAEQAYYKKIIKRAIDYVNVNFTAEKDPLATKFKGYGEHRTANDSFIERMSKLNRISPALLQ